MYLGIDTTNNNLCYALLDADKNCLFEDNIFPSFDTAEQLAPRIDELFKKFSITMEHISQIVSVTGPGGFSGVRIGTSFLTGLTFGAQCKIKAISSLEALALSIDQPPHEALIFACLNARREAVYLSILDSSHTPLLKDQLVTIDTLDRVIAPFKKKPYFLAGHGYSILEPYLCAEHKISHIETTQAAQFTAYADKINGHRPNLPTYMRLPDAKLAQKKYPSL